MKERYFDHAATTPVLPCAVETLLPFFTEDFGNEHSAHSWGRRAHDAVEQARAQLAAALSSDACEVYPEQIVFTSGATEANNWVLGSFENAAVSPFEHSSVYETALQFGHQILDLDDWPFDQVEADLISVMSVNNETGQNFAINQLVEFSLDKAYHCDITQQAVKYETDLSGVAYASLSSHKFGGPKGVGALYIQDGMLAPFILGGEQEHDMRAGTVNVAGIVGMGAAAEYGLLHRGEYFEHVQGLRQGFLEEIDQSSGPQVNSPEDGAPHILSISYEGLEGAAIVLEADAAGFGISSGAACSTGSTEPSQVLTALGVPPEWIRGTIRVSFGWCNTQESSRELARTLNRITKDLRRLKS